MVCVPTQFRVGRLELGNQMRHLQHLAHVVIFALTVHVWHLVTSDRLLDAYVDVGLDKIADIALHVTHIVEQ
jgi:hypothetical protein